MDRHRGGGDRYGSNPESPHHFRNIRPSRSSDAPMNYPHRRSPNATNFRGGFSAGGANHRPFESPTRRPPSDGGFRPMDGSGFGSNHQAPLAGQKRGFPSSGLGGSPDHFDGGSFAKLFVGSVPRTVTEEDVRPLFEEHGNVLEVALIKDKRTGQQQGCCFIKFATSGEADRAIRALHNQYTLPGGAGPIQVRYADGERERLVEYKLFVGSLNKQASEKEVEEVFSPYGRVEDVYLMRDDLRQSRGCGFVKFSNRDMAMAAINALNGIYTMRGCDQPLTVRFADPKRPRAGESRGPAFGGPGFGPRFQPPPGVRPTPNLGDPMNGRVPPNAWHSTSPHSMGPSSNAGVHAFGNQLLPRSTDAANSLNLNGPADGSLPGSISSSQQNFSQSLPQVPSAGPQVSPSQKPIQSPQHLPPSLQQLHNQTPPSYSQTQPSYASLRPFGQRQIPHSVGQTPFSQGLQSQQLPGLSAHLAGSQSQVHQNASSATSQGTPLNINIQPHAQPSPIQQQLPSPAHQQIPKPLQPVAQMISKQKQSLQASYQFSRQAFSELQQQYRQMQPTNQNLATQQNSQLQQMQPSNQSVATQPNSQLQQMQPSNQSLASQQMQPSNQSLTTQQNSQLQPTNQSLTAQQNSHFQMQQSNQSLRSQQNSQLQQLQPSNQSLASQQSSQLQMQPSNQSLASQQISQFHQLQPTNQSPALQQSSQLQMQLPNPNLASQQTSQATKQQSQWGGVPSQTHVSTPAIDVLSTTSATAVPVATQVATPAKCDWTEHTSPDGYKYYHNSSTGESKWEKPEELMLYEQQQKHSAQPLQTQSQADSYPQGLSSQQVSQIPQTQLRPQGQVPQSHQTQSHFQGQVPQTLQTQSSHLQGLPTQQQVSQTPQHTQVPQTQQHTQVPQTPQHTQVPQTQQQTQSHLQNLSTQQQIPQTQQNQSYPQGPMQHVSQTQQAHLQNQHQTQMRHQQQQFQRPSPYQASGGMGHQNVQDFNYPHMQMGGNSVNDPGRFQQGFQSSQEWAWKNNKPAGA